MSSSTLAVLLFFLTYTIIVSEKVHRTLAALLGGMLMILLGVLSQETAFHALDLNVIFLLTGMMMIAYLLGETGVFQWMAVNAVRLGKGDPVWIMVILCAVTAVSSALLDNVTVVVLMAPVTLFVATDLGYKSDTIFDHAGVGIQYRRSDNANWRPTQYYDRQPGRH